MSDLQGFEADPAMISTRPGAVGRFGKTKLRADSEIRALISNEQFATVAARYRLFKGLSQLAPRPARLAGRGKSSHLQGFNGGVAA